MSGGGGGGGREIGKEEKGQVSDEEMSVCVWGGGEGGGGGGREIGREEKGRFLMRRYRPGLVRCWCSVPTETSLPPLNAVGR